MSTAYLIMTILTAAANVGIAVCDLLRVRFVVENSRAVGVPGSWLPVLAVLKGAGAVGLVLGIVGVSQDVSLLRYLGVAAAVGLVLFFTGALIAHLRARVFGNIFYPAGYWLLAIASLVLVVSQ